MQFLRRKDSFPIIRRYSQIGSDNSQATKKYRIQLGNNGASRERKSNQVRECHSVVTMETVEQRGNSKERRLHKQNTEESDMRRSETGSNRLSSNRTVSRRSETGESVGKRETQTRQTRRVRVSSLIRRYRVGVCHRVSH